ncbi:hypothetical protein Tco_1123454 [Tanacetum coccineum]|uniref:Uncharacterized protein n=1 Tax=Tanacetum coccineum TaxID=301880 RepID=A0ABQ5J3N6_9ASTR
MAPTSCTPRRLSPPSIMEGGKNNHFAGLDEFHQRVEELLEKQEEKLRKLSIEYNEELYPHMLSAIAERRWLISHGMRLAAMSALESQEVKQSFGDVVKCALARGWSCDQDVPYSDIPVLIGVPVSVADCCPPKVVNFSGEAWEAGDACTSWQFREKSLSQYLGFLPCANLSLLCMLANFV